MFVLLGSLVQRMARSRMHINIHMQALLHFHIHAYTCRCRSIQTCWYTDTCWYITCWYIDTYTCRCWLLDIHAYMYTLAYTFRCWLLDIHAFMYSQSHVGWYFRMLFQSSKLKARTSLFTEPRQTKSSSFELWAFENVTPSGVGCTHSHIHADVDC